MASLYFPISVRFFWPELEVSRVMDTVNRAKKKGKTSLNRIPMAAVPIMVQGTFSSVVIQLKLFSYQLFYVCVWPIERCVCSHYPNRKFTPFVRIQIFSANKSFTCSTSKMMEHETI